jgi:hypothetical protein
MACGIYKLNFKGTNKVYIGQSNNIYHRYSQHLTKLANNAASRVLQEAYNQYGKPSIEILLECAEDELDDNETAAISVFDSVSNGFNTLKCATDIPRLVGDEHGRALYSNDLIVSAMLAIINNPSLMLPKVAKLVGVSVDNLYLIANGTNHRWLSSVYPEEYNKMLQLNGTRRASSQSASNRGVVYPKVLSPEGVEYAIENIKGFSREHNLDDGHLGKVLHSKAKSHKGWKLA